jgi:hypothetical protein
MLNLNTWAQLRDLAEKMLEATLTDADHQQIQKLEFDTRLIIYFQKALLIAAFAKWKNAFLLAEINLIYELANPNNILFPFPIDQKLAHLERGILFPLAKIEGTPLQFSNGLILQSLKEASSIIVKVQYSTKPFSKCYLISPHYIIDSAESDTKVELWDKLGKYWVGEKLDNESFRVSFDEPNPAEFWIWLE